MLNVSLKQVKAIFNDQLVASKMQTATAKALKRAGAFVQRTARRSMRKVGKKGLPSRPGKPPKVRRGDIKRHLYFVVDREIQTVVIGPVKLPWGNDAPKILEHGGPQEWKYYKDGELFFTSTVFYRARPFMAPALEKEQSKLPELWDGAFKK